MLQEQLLPYHAFADLNAEDQLLNHPECDLVRTTDVEQRLEVTVLVVREHEQPRRPLHHHPDESHDLWVVHVQHGLCLAEEFLAVALGKAVPQ